MKAVLSNGMIISGIPAGTTMQLVDDGVDVVQGGGQPAGVPVQPVVTKELKFATFKHRVEGVAGQKFVFQIPVPADGKSLTVQVEQMPGSVQKPIQVWQRTIKVKVNHQPRDDMNAGPDTSPMIPIGLGEVRPGAGKAVWMDVPAMAEFEVDTQGAVGAIDFFFWVIVDDQQR